MSQLNLKPIRYADHLFKLRRVRYIEGEIENSLTSEYALVCQECNRIVVETHSIHVYQEIYATWRRSGLFDTRILDKIMAYLFINLLPKVVVTMNISSPYQNFAMSIKGRIYVHQEYIQDCLRPTIIENDICQFSPHNIQVITRCVKVHPYIPISGEFGQVRKRSDLASRKRIRIMGGSIRDVPARMSRFECEPTILKYSFPTPRQSLSPEEIDHVIDSYQSNYVIDYIIDSYHSISNYKAYDSDPSLATTFEHMSDVD